MVSRCIRYLVRWSIRVLAQQTNTRVLQTLEMSILSFISSRTRDSVDPISSVSQMILTRVSPRVFACKNLCYRYIRKKKNCRGFEPRTSHTSCSCLSTELLRRDTCFRLICLFELNNI